VIAESPAAGSEVVRNSIVTLTVSKGAEEVTVPDLVGSSEDDARSALRSAGLLASVFRVTSAQPTGTVIAQDPKAGERVAKGAKVRLNVSKGAPPPPPTTTTTPPPVTTVTTTKTTTTTTATTTTATTATTTTAPTTTAPVATTIPDVRGKSQTQARHALRDVGLVAAVAYVHASVPFDQVVAQFPKPGASAKRGDRVRINVSLGPTAKPQRAVPDVTSDDETSAIQRLRAAGFTAETVDRETADGSADGVVLSQDPGGGTQAPRGSTVTIYVGRFSG
jgi:serine/threonine-protein kinase